MEGRANEDLMETKIHHIPCATSTQDAARDMLDDGRLRVGDVLLAGEQSAGRGRFGRIWLSPYGGIYATLVCPMAEDLSLKTGLAIVHVVRNEGVNATLKWPNDVLVDERKLGGILVEQHGRYALVGIGLNLHAAPLSDATCIADHLENPGDVNDWIGAIVRNLLPTLGEPLDLDAYSRLCCTLGKPVCVERGAVKITGHAEAIGHDGSLIVRVGKRRQYVNSGECRHLRSYDATENGDTTSFRTNTGERRDNNADDS
jgi:BirA family biotin operon repressor/biotin-[acetyl-CoA-carboxylase] ligase